MVTEIDTSYGYRQYRMKVSDLSKVVSLIDILRSNRVSVSEESERISDDIWVVNLFVPETTTYSDMMMFIKRIPYKEEILKNFEEV